jgi:hypothetical protein
MLVRRRGKSEAAPRFDFAEWATTVIDARELARQLRWRAALEQVLNDAMQERPLNFVVAVQAAHELERLNREQARS